MFFYNPCKMKILGKNLRIGEVSVIPESADDLWSLSQIIEQGDIVMGKTLRKIKIGPEESQKSVRKPVYLKLKVEKPELQEHALRLLGTIIEGPEDIPTGSHHSFSIEEGTGITIIKDTWHSFQIGRLEEAARSALKTLICVFDRESAAFAVLKREGYEVLSKISGNVEKKG